METKPGLSVSVSVVLTVYNRADYLGLAIESFLAQTYQDAELVVWDDGSTDGSLAIANSYAEKDSRIRVTAAKHQGRVDSLYAAMKTVKGDYVGWLDSDDLLCPTTLANTVTVLDCHADIGMVYTDYWVIDEAGTVKGLGNRCQIPYSKQRLLVDFMTFHFRLFRLELYHLVDGFDRTLKHVEDYDFSLRLSEVAEIYHLKLPLYCYRSHGSSISQQSNLEQIHFSYLAINSALIRRGMDKDCFVEVRPGPQFVLRRKPMSS